MIFFSIESLLAIGVALRNELSHTFFIKAMKKVGKESKRGGAREGAGRPETGQTKAKTSISVNSEVLEKALQKWGGKLSPLVEKLLRSYLE